MGGESNDIWVPSACDGCGRSPEACGMYEQGWTTRPVAAGFAGSYCFACADLLRLVPRSIECTECQRVVEDDDRAEDEGWRWYLTPSLELHPYCPDCR